MFLIFVYCFILFTRNPFLKRSEFFMDPREYYKPPITKINISNSSGISISSSVFIKENIENVWEKLIDYQNLTDIVPYLLKSQIISKTKNETILYQESSKNILGFPYTNRMTLDVKEDKSQFFDRSITFSLVKSNLFSKFQGKWIVKYHTDEYTWLNYSIDASTKIPVPFFVIKNKMNGVIKKTMDNIVVIFLKKEDEFI